MDILRYPSTFHIRRYRRLLSLLIYLFSGPFFLPSSNFVSAFGVASSRSGKMRTIAYPKAAMDKNVMLDEDTREFHQFSAAAADLSLVHVSKSNVMSVIRSARNWDLDSRQNYLYRFALGKSNNGVVDEDPATLPPIPLDSSVQMYLPSPSGEKTVIVRLQAKDDDGCKKSKATVVEAWYGPSLLRRIPVDETKHGKIIQDSTGFGSPVWSPDEEFLLYSAERVRRTTAPFWSNNEETKCGDAEKIPLRGGQFVLGEGQVEHWGERYNAQEPVLDLYIMNLSTGRTGRIENVPENFHEGNSAEKIVHSSEPTVTLGQAVWHPSQNKVAFTAWDAGSRRLGMVYCRNRCSAIYEADVGRLLLELAMENENKGNSEEKDGPPVCITKGLPFSRSPRYTHTQDGQPQLIFLSREDGFASHDACMGLYRWEDSTEVVQNIVPVVDVPWKSGAKVFGMGFPGLFLGQLPYDCDVKSTDYILTTTLFGSAQRIIRVDCVAGSVALLEIPQLDELTSQSLCSLAPNGDMIVSAMACNRPASLWRVAAKYLVQAPIQVEGKIVVKAHRVAAFTPISSSTFSSVKKTIDMPFEMQILSIAPQAIEGARSEPIQAILLLPRTSEKEKIPLITVPHGGPHSCSTSMFSPGFAFLANRYAVLFPNYRGSIGFGEASLQSLLTRIGNVDVEDVISCTKHVIENFPVIDKERIGICGGSHGGFLAAQCTSQYPDFFKAAAMRNPVTNIASMFTSTDIPDWCISEVMGTFDKSQLSGPSFDQIMKMYEKSPISRIDHVKAPTLVALGMVDLRVPPSQGLEWFYSLRSAGVPTKLLKYPNDSHALDRDVTEADHWLHIRQWFDEYLPHKQKRP